MHVPVIMYHSIAPKEKTIYNSWLTTDLKIFEKQLEYLKKKGYKSINLQDLYNYKFKNQKIPKKSIILTFDDGYLDNYVFAYSLLKKYGFQATIFINPNFVENAKKRENFENIKFDLRKIKDLEYIGYLNWEELLEMENSGIMDIQSHSLSHTFYFKSDWVVDILTEKNIKDYYWFFWNSSTDKKEAIHWMGKKDFSSFLKGYHGYPIFEFGNSLGIIKFVPNEKIIRLSKNLTKNKDFNKKEVINKLNSYRLNKGILETKEESNNRYNAELIDSKKVIEKKLNKKVSFLCWPCGSFNKLAEKIANKNYLMYTKNERSGFNFSFNTRKDKRKIIHRCNDGHVFNNFFSIIGFKITLFCHRNYKHIYARFLYLSYLSIRSVYKQIEIFMIK